MHRAACLLFLLAGCDLVFQLHRTDGGDGGSDGGGNDAAVDPNCSPLSMLGDDFETDQLAAWFPLVSANGGPAEYGVANGHLELRAFSANGNVVVDSETYYAFAQPFTMRIGDNGIGTSSLRVTLAGLTPQRSAIIIRTGNQLTFSVRDDINETPVATLTYDPVQHAYVRAEWDGAQISFATSMDGMVYTTKGSRPLDGMELVRLSMQTSRPGNASGFTVFIDDLMGGVRQGHACPISELHDDFERSELGPFWARSAFVRGTIGIDAGAVLVTAPAEMYLRAPKLYDLRDSQIVVEVPKMVESDPDKHVALTLEAPDGDRVSFHQVNGVLAAKGEHAGQSIQPFAQTYSASLHRWWRIRNSGATTTWEVSGDGTQWQPFGSTTDLTDLERVQVQWYVYSIAATPDSARLDNINP